MGKTSAKILFALLALAAFGANAHALDAAPDIQRILDKGALTVAFYSKDVYPLFYRDPNGEFVGHEVELAKKIANALGVRLEVNRDARSFDGIIDIIGEGRADLGISLISMTPSRVMKVRFSRPYLVVHPVLIINRMSRYDISDVNSLKGLASERIRISEKAGTSYAEMARSVFPMADVSLEKEWDAVLQNVADGKSDAALRDEIGVNNYLRDNKDQLLSLKTLTLTEINDQVGIAIHPDSVNLEHWLNVFLRQNGYPITARTLFEEFAK